MRYIYILFCIFCSCTNENIHIAEFIESEDLPVEEISNAKIFYTEKGNVRLKLFSEYMYRVSESVINLRGDVIAVFVGSYNQDSSVLTCNNATINRVSQKMTAISNVRLLGNDSTELLTEELIFDQKNNLIYTEKEVIIRTQDELISGIGFESSPDFLDYEIKEATGSFNIEKPYSL